MSELQGEALVETLERQFVTVNDDVRVGGRAINVLRPRSAEDLIDEQEFDRDERLPYWAELWPSSTVLADFVITQNNVPKRCIELGCGVGLVSIAAVLAGHEVLATDYYEEALRFTRANSFRNLGREIDTRVVDWRAMPDDLPQFDMALASDVLYEPRYAPLVADVIARVIAPTGCAYIADPGRVAAATFIDACSERGMRVAAQAERPYLAGKVRQTITVYEIRR